MEDRNYYAVKSINRSGFPFQLRIENDIRVSGTEHLWTVESSEHAWRSADGQRSGFADLVLKHQNLSTLRIVIECKTGDCIRVTPSVYTSVDDVMREAKPHA
jgi:hypothetical protein